MDKFLLRYRASALCGLVSSSTEKCITLHYLWQDCVNRYHTKRSTDWICRNFTKHAILDGVSLKISIQVPIAGSRRRLVRIRGMLPVGILRARVIQFYTHAQSRLPQQRCRGRRPCLGFGVPPKKGKTWGTPTSRKGARCPFESCLGEEPSKKCIIIVRPRSGDERPQASPPARVTYVGDYDIV